MVTWLSLNTSFTSAIWVVLVGAFIDGVIDLFRPFRYFVLVGLFVLFMLVGLFEPVPYMYVQFFLHQDIKWEVPKIENNIFKDAA